MSNICEKGEEWRYHSWSEGHEQLVVPLDNNSDFLCSTQCIFHLAVCPSEIQDHVDKETHSPHGSVLITICGLCLLHSSQFDSRVCI
jgi:hypothetical protein